MAWIPDPNRALVIIKKLARRRRKTSLPESGLSLT